MRTVDPLRPVSSRHSSGTALFTALALVAFAGNSVLCRLALRGGAIDPASFSTIRFATGAATLLAIGWMRGAAPEARRGAWRRAIIIAVYAVPFSYAYTRLGASTGALILFGCVQVTMLVAALRSGERPDVIEWLGLAAALAGLVILVRPGLTAPSPVGAALMSIAGLCWGLYSLAGRGAGDPIAATTGAFLRASLLLGLVSAAAIRTMHVRIEGAALAALSGSLATGVGYVIWYTALARLSATRAAIVQLAVPPLAALAGVLLLGEPLQPRLMVASLLILGGIALAVAGRARLIAPDAAR